MLKPSLQLKQGQSLSMTPQLQQAIQLLQLPVLDLNAQLQEALEQNIMLDVPRPTNCKFDKSKSQLWVTSAREGLSSHQLSKYPLSGDVFKISLSGIC